MLIKTSKICIIKMLFGLVQVGTWSNDDAQKQSEKKSEPATETWGTGSWNDDVGSKRPCLQCAL